LFPYDSGYISKVARQMKEELGVRRVAPAHCTGNLAFKIFPRSLWRELQLRRRGIRGDVPVLVLRLPIPPLLPKLFTALSPDSS
jgi:hypothetical protein